jgi:UDP-N-acetylglucosamine 2-epimerase (non-hydrolysing)
VKIVAIVGARPNFIKIAPLLKELRRHPEFQTLLVHTGQHYDVTMADQFFQELEIPRPDVSLDVGSGSHAYQTAEVMKRLEPVLEREHPDLVVVVGDVNSTLAGALTAVKLQIPVAHVEAGLRSFDRSMPEEINRLVTDAVSQYLFVTEESGKRNLLREGVHEGSIFFVGNVMIDTLEECRPLWEKSMILRRFGLRKREYGVVTLHRPSNVDDSTVWEGITKALLEVSQHLPLIFPVHPRTRKRLETMESVRRKLFFEPPVSRSSGWYCLEPLGYLDFMSLVASAKIVLTDSGGLQEETTVLGIPCLTLRENTERPVTVTHGTNRVIGSSPERITKEALQILVETQAPRSSPPLWDGHASQRIVAILREQVR